MFETLLQMIALVGCGVVWRSISPGSLSPEDVRRGLTESVYYLFLPALVLIVLWQAPLGIDSIQISLLASTGILFGFLAAGLFCRVCGAPGSVTGAIMLAAAFPNATYLGLPVLQATFGDWARSIALQYDLFAGTPLLFTLGILVAQYHGTGPSESHIFKRLLQIPPLWAAIIGVILNLGSVPLNPNLAQILNMLGATVIPLMLVSLGLSLQWRSISKYQLPGLLAVVLIQLLLTPLLVWQLASFTDLEGDMLTAVVLEAAMPSMVLGIVLCDRYKLDTALYAVAVTVTTLVSVLTLPLWYAWV